MWEKINHGTFEQPSKLKQNHFHWKKLQLMKENEELNILKSHVLPKRRLTASKSYINCVNIYDDHVYKILSRRTR